MFFLCVHCRGSIQRELSVQGCIFLCWGRARQDQGVEMLVECVRGLLSQWKIGIQVSQHILMEESSEKSRQSRE